MEPHQALKEFMNEQKNLYERWRQTVAPKHPPANMNMDLWVLFSVEYTSFICERYILR